MADCACSQGCGVAAEQYSGGTGTHCVVGKSPGMAGADRGEHSLIRKAQPRSLSSCLFGDHHEYLVRDSRNLLLEELQCGRHTCRPRQGAPSSAQQFKHSLQVPATRLWASASLSLKRDVNSPCLFTQWRGVCGILVICSQVVRRADPHMVCLT